MKKKDKIPKGIKYSYFHCSKCGEEIINMKQLHSVVQSAKDYLAGKITISKAAEKASITIWEMEQYLVSTGFKSRYSIEDLKQEAIKAKPKPKKTKKLLKLAYF